MSIVNKMRHNISLLRRIYGQAFNEELGEMTARFEVLLRDNVDKTFREHPEWRDKILNISPLLWSACNLVCAVNYYKMGNVDGAFVALKESEDNLEMAMHSPLIREVLGEKYELLKLGYKVLRGNIESRVDYRWIEVWSEDMINVMIVAVIRIAKD